MIHLGDCLDILPTLPDQSIDHILTDIPYGTTACKWDSIIPFEPMWKELKRIIKDNGCIALFGTEPFSSYLRISNIEWFKYDWVWNKKRISNPLLAKKQPLRNIELISVFYNKQPTYNPQPTLKRTGKGLSQKGHNLKHHIETTNAKYITDRNTTNIGYPKVLLEHIKVLNNLSFTITYLSGSGFVSFHLPYALIIVSSFIIEGYLSKVFINGIIPLVAILVRHLLALISSANLS